ncbi:acetate kinase [Corynebacterium sanguinis]|uniref:acetate kinase n=1 Tax=Corynebacterium sanguinis TaxID=2594913 RepID=UPI0021A66C4B|nr:acetate kinase [Corynebacterium sanguinis]MCT2251084.1 acetate kinase [Corynebacterium sanguinis]
MSYVLVINSGSSSIKFQIVDPTSSASDTAFVSGLVEKIGEKDGRISVTHNGEKHDSNQPIRDHRGGLQLAVAMLDSLGIGPTQIDLVAVGHRVVHGGQTFSGPALITDEVVEQIRDLIPLAPLHNPANIDGIEVARDLLPNIPHVAVFDTGFFSELPAAAATYAINSEVAEANQVRRYGFHGTSHEFVSGQVPGILGRDSADTNQIVLHLGNGASCSAVKGGAPIDTSMGLTPLAGLVMGTRTGDVDPGIIFHLHRQAGMSIDEIDTLFNRQSGIKGLSGVNDFRDLHAKIDQGDDDAKLAFDVYITQLRRYIGSYMIALGRVDAITFTAGVGENDDATRAAALAGLENYGIVIDENRNAGPNDGPREITTDDSTVKVLIVPTNEELAIAQKSAEVAAAQ